MPYSLQKVNRIPRKTLYRLGEDDVDFPGIRILYHFPEFVPPGRTSTGDPVIRIYPGVFPIRVTLDQRAVIADLCG